MVFIRMLKKLILGPLNLYDKYKTNKQNKAGIKALEAYMLVLGEKKEGLSIFESYSKTLSNNPFYWISAYWLSLYTQNTKTIIANMSNNSDLFKKAYVQLGYYENGDFLALYTKIEQLFAQQHYESALILLEAADAFAHKTIWFWHKLFKCYLAVGDFDKAEKSLKPLYTLGDKKPEYEIELYKKKAEANIDKLANLEKCYQLDQKNELKCAFDYIDELLHVDQKDKAEKVIKNIWKIDPSMKIGLLLDKVFSDLVPVERFTALSEIMKLNPENIFSKFFLARGALDAGLFLMARELLMEVAKTKPELAFPLLSRLELLEKNDLEASNKWLTKAVECLID